MCFLCALRLLSELPDLEVFLAEARLDDAADLPERVVREVHGVGSHVRDVTGFVETLGDLHRLPDREPVLARRGLLQGRSRERSWWAALPLGLSYHANGPGAGLDGLYESHRDGLVAELGVFFLLRRRVHGGELAAVLR